MIAFARELTAVLRQRDPSADPRPVIRHFGVPTIARVLARVARGLQLALALEAALVARGDRPLPDRFPLPRLSRPRPMGAPRAQRMPDAAAANLDPMPSAEEIAKRLRRQPMGEVIVDICLDLGIEPNHPLWQDVQWAVIVAGGSSARLLLNRFKQMEAGVRLVAGTLKVTAPKFRTPEALAGTGPPG